MRLDLRPAREDDQPFLRQLVPREQDWRAQYPGAEHRIILAGGRPVGRMLVARLESEIRLVDIVLDAAHRKTGIGTRLILELIEESEKTAKPIRLTVSLANPAERLYRRLGFVPIGDDGVLEQMERAAGTRL
jgi:GNAT superfamily N-acetyltransferase